MQLMFLLGQAFAGSVVFVGLDPDPSLLPQESIVPLDELSPRAEVSADDVAALEALAAELEAVRPLVDEFDGELAIMSRLDAAISEVHVLRDEADRELLYRALVLQGFAVHRYFQDQLPTDAAAEPYRIELNGQVTVKAWVDATALLPDADPRAEELPDPAQQAAFDEARAQIRLAPRGTVATKLPEGAVLQVDGVEQKGARAKVAPGYHRAAVLMDGVVVARAEGRVAGDELSVDVGAMASELSALQPALSQGPEAYGLDQPVVELLAQAAGPVRVVVPGKKQALVYVLEGQALVLEVEEEAPEASSPAQLHLAVGGGWMYDGGWYVENYYDGAPAELSTVNAFTPVVHAGFDLNPVGPLTLGAGADLQLPVGAYHTLPSAESTVRPRVHPHAALGIRQAQLTVGYLFPWQLALGARARLPLGERFELTGAAVYGKGLSFEQEGNPEGDFQAQDTLTAWLAVGGRFGLGG